MHKSSLIDILKMLSKEELKDFGAFISCSYLNKSSLTVKLFKEVRKHAPNFSSDALAKEKMWDKIYPGKKYNYGIMKNLIFGLKKLCEDYISFIYWKKSSAYDRSLISGFMERNAEELFLKKAADYNNRLDKKPVKDQEYYDEKLFVQPMIDEYNQNRIMYNKSRTDTNDLLVQSFLMHYLLNCFHLAVEMQKTNNLHDLRFLQYLLEYFKDGDEFFSGTPLLKIHYYLMLSFLDIMEDEYFKRARNIFNEIYNLLPQNEIKNIYNILTLLCLFKSGKGKHEYSSILLRLNIEIFRNKVLSHRNDGSIELEAYRNIVKLADNRDEYKILKDFINSNKHKVNSRSPETIIQYSEATLRFAEGGFDECLRICSKINFKDFWELNTVNHFFKSDIRILELKAHYELNNIESVVSSIDSYKHFLNNAREINEMNKSGLRLFLNFLNNLVQIRVNSKENQLVELKMQITSIDNVSSKRWLLEKIETLEKSLPI